MRMCSLVFVALIGVAFGPASAAGQENREAMIAAARELARQMELFQQVVILDPGPWKIRGLSREVGETRNAVAAFRQQLRNKAARDDLYVAFDLVDRRITTLLGVVQNEAKLNAGLRLASRQTQAALHDLHFALFTGDGAPARQAQALLRQTLALVALTEDLDRTINWLYYEQEPLKTWSTDVTAVRRAVVAFQELQEKKAPAAKLKESLQQLDQAWEKVVNRWRGSVNQDLLQPSVAQVDQGIARLASLAGIKNRRAPLSNPFAQ